MKTDLHTHSTYSDGTLEPEELIQKAAQHGITHLALADHDTTHGLESAYTAAKTFNVTVIPAIEINSREMNSSIHILGYFINDKSEKLQQILEHHRQLRAKRAELMIERLRHMGIKISISDFNGRKEKSAIGRPHLADKLKELGIVFSRQEAFEKYLTKGKPAYVSYEGPTPEFAIETILNCQGIPVLAHPGFFVQKETIINLVKKGLQGMEIYYPSHSKEQIRYFSEIAKQLNLVVTGGSDYHGPGSGHERLGEVAAPESAVEDLLERKRKLFG